VVHFILEQTGRGIYPPPGPTLLLLPTHGPDHTPRSQPTHSTRGAGHPPAGATLNTQRERPVGATYYSCKYFPCYRAPITHIQRRQRRWALSWWPLLSTLPPQVLAHITRSVACLPASCLHCVVLTCLPACLRLPTSDYSNRHRQSLAPSSTRRPPSPPSTTRASHRIASHPRPLFIRTHWGRGAAPRPHSHTE